MAHNALIHNLMQLKRARLRLSIGFFVFSAAGEAAPAYRVGLAERATTGDLSWGAYRPNN
jgi:hypothetical protein